MDSRGERLSRTLRNVVIGLVAAALLSTGVALATIGGEKYMGTTYIEPGSPFCFEVGKDSELGGDCFCVEEGLTTVEELDCLIKSGVVPENERDSFLRGMGLLDPAPVQSEPTSQQPEPQGEPSEVVGESPPNSNIVVRPFCWNIGKESELGKDCFCVEGELNTLDELDCLVASGIIPESEYESYRTHILSKN